MEHKNTTLAIAAMVAAAVVVVTAIAFAIPQHAFTHYGDHSHHSNTILRLHHPLQGLDLLSELHFNLNFTT